MHALADAHKSSSRRHKFGEFVTTDAPIVVDDELLAFGHFSSRVPETSKLGAEGRRCSTWTAENQLKTEKLRSPAAAESTSGNLPNYT
jgi:hypothetical protein